MNDLLHNWQVLWIPAVVLIISQCIKLVVDWKRGQGFDLKHLNSYGGMPSTHTALFTSVTLMIGIVHGFTTPLFALAVFTSAAIIRDAVGIRFALGTHGRLLNHLIDLLPQERQKEFPDNINERLGHTYKEAFAGFILGIVLTLLFVTLI